MPTSTADDIALRQRFQKLAAAWKARSRYLSNTAQMAMLPEYQRIIGMGGAAIPLLLEELRSEPNQWFWALGAITDENPVDPDAAGDVTRMSEAWLDWGRKRGFISR
jgi:hypothetical protein